MSPTPRPMHRPHPSGAGRLSPVRMVMARLGVLGAVVAVLASIPAPAYAHGISGEAADLSVLEFIPLGMEHMLLGWDHLAFIAGVLLLAQSFRLSLKLISLFVLGHSTTLIVATLAGWEISPVVVDAVIAFSVAFVGVVGIFGRPQRWGWFAAAVAGFGLVHGLGLASRFQALGLPAEGQLWKLIAFNVGIEIGQATAIMVMLVVGVSVSTYLLNSSPQEPGDSYGRVDQPVEEELDKAADEKPVPPRDRAVLVTQLASATLFMGGSVAGALLLLDSFTATHELPQAELAADTTCGISDRTETLPGTGGHPPREFYGPDQTAPVTDFGHALGDGYVIVLYAPDLPDDQVADLRQFVQSPSGEGVLAGAVTPEVADRLPGGTLDDSTAMVALQTRDVMTCSQLEVDSLESFSTSWLGAAVS